MLVMVGLSVLGDSYFRSAVGEGFQAIDRVDSYLSHTSKARDHFEEQIQEWKNLLLRGHDEEVFYRHLSQYYDSERATLTTASTLNDAAADFPELQPVVDQFFVEHKNLAKKYRAAIRLYNDSITAPQEVADKLVLGLDDKPRQLLSKIGEILTAERRATYLKVDALLVVGQWLSVALILLLTLAGVVTIFWLFNLRVVRPLQQAIKVAEKISAEDLTGTITSEREDEIGALLGSLATMQQSLKRSRAESKSFTEKLEQAVADRTRELSREISEREEAESASEQLSHAIQNVPVGIALFDSNDTLTFFNEQYRAMDPTSVREATKIGVRFEEIIRTLVELELVEDAVGREEEWIRHRMERHRNPKGTFEVRRADSTLQVSENRTPDGGTLHIVVDVSEQRDIEEQLRRAQRMEAVGQLTGGVAHDFNNLLAVMIGNAEILEERLGDDDEINQNIQAIIRSVNRGSSLTNRLLAFSRQQALTPVTADVAELISGLEDMIRRTMGETIDLKIETAPDLWPPIIDPHQFENAVINMAINARDAMPEGGTLLIKSTNVVLDEDYSKQEEEVAPGDYVELAVSDTGAGMPPDVLDRVFEPFFTTKDVGEGSGLGLSMVYGFAKQSNGHVTIHSEIGHGTTVKLYMPRSQESLRPQDMADEKSDHVPGSERILVVEDDPNVRNVPVRLLRTYGYKIVEAGDGKEAIAHLENDQKFDLIFTDIVLPGGMNGVEIAQEAQRIQPNIKVLFTTGYAEGAVVDELDLDPAVMLVNKPYRKAELLDKVRTILDKNGD